MEKPRKQSLSKGTSSGDSELKQAGQSNETLRFELDEDGAVVKMWERNEYSNRLS